MPLPLAAAVASSDDYLLALAQGLSGLLGITAAVLIFVVERQVRRYRVHDRAYAINLVVLVLVSAFTIFLAALTWWAWASTAPAIDLLFCWSPDVWLALLFGGVVLAAAVSFVLGLAALFLQWRKGLADDWDP
jgi:uncharacterized membrane-anchored protein YitT (DUF2179 family)